MDNLTDLVLVVIGISGIFCAMALAWLCAKVTTIQQFITTPLPKDNTLSNALHHLQESNDEAARLAKHTSDQVDVAAELGHQSAAGDRKVAKDLAKSIDRADNEVTGEPGAAADAGLKSDPNGDQ